MIITLFNLFTLDSAKSKTDKFTNEIKLNNKQQHSEVLPDSFPMNGHTFG